MTYLKNILTLVILVFFNTSLIASNPTNWTKYTEDNNLLIEYRYQNCQLSRFDEEKVILRLTNKLNKDISVSWKEEMWYDNECINCNLKNENEMFKTIQLKAKETLAGECDRNNRLTIFSKFSEKLIDMPGVNKIIELTKFELKKIIISYE